MARLLAILGTEGLGVWLAHHLSAPHRARLGGEWAVTAGLPELLVTLLHVLAWVMTWWLLAGTLHDVVLASIDLRRAASRGDTGPTRARRLAPLWVQRIVNQAMGTLLMLGVMAGPAAAASPSAPIVGTQQVVTPPAPVVPPGSPAPAPTAEPLVAPIPESGGVPAPVAPDEMPVPAADDVDDLDPVDPVDDYGAPAEHTVAVGENLWVIARATLSAGSGTPPSDRDVHGYWLRLIDANTFSSRSPDLIHPGEVLVLPEVEATSQTSSSKAPVEPSL